MNDRELLRLHFFLFVSKQLEEKWLCEIERIVGSNTLKDLPLI